MNIELALMTGVDIPIIEYQTTIHQPTIKEISMIGEDEFFTGIQILTIDANKIVSENIQINNFQLLTEILSEDKNKKNTLINVLTLLFPKYTFLFTPSSIIFRTDNNEKTLIIDEDNFVHLQDILKQMFCLSSKTVNDFNPEGEKAKEIAQKLQRARQRVAAQKSNSGEKTTLAQYLSIVTVGIKSMSLYETINLTIYQLYDLVERMNLYYNWDIDLRSRLVPFAGEKRTPLDNWMKSIH